MQVYIASLKYIAVAGWPNAHVKQAFPPLLLWEIHETMKLHVLFPSLFLCTLGYSSEALLLLYIRRGNISSASIQTKEQGWGKWDVVYALQKEGLVNIVQNFLSSKEFSISFACTYDHKYLLITLPINWSPASNFKGWNSIPKPILWSYPTTQPKIWRGN